MNEVKHIHLGRQQFTISLEAYKELREYLDAIERQSGSNGADIVEEVEARLAELLTEHGNTPAKVVLPADVAYLKDQMGEPRDFKDDESTDTDESIAAESSPRQLFRDPDHGMIAGVAAGLATYLHVDVVIVRLLFVALVFAGGSGILLYIVLWLIVPEARSGSDRLRMRGQAVTVEALKGLVDRADVPAAARRANKTFGRILSTAVKVILTLIGIGFVIGGIGMMLVSGVALVYGLAHGLQVGNTVLFPKGSKETGLLIAAATLVILTGIMLAVSGLSLIRKRWAMPGWSLAAVLVAFVVAASTAGGLAASSAPQLRDRYNSLTYSRFIQIKPFSKLNFIGNNVFYIATTGPTTSVEIKSLGEVNTDAIKVSEQDGVLTVDTSHFKPNRDCNLICPYGVTNTEIVIHTPDGGEGIPIAAPPDVPMTVEGKGGPY